MITNEEKVELRELLLKEELEKAALQVSFYNAAEGADYGNERNMRNVAYRRLEEAKQACREAGIDVQSILRPGKYLL